MLGARLACHDLGVHAFVHAELQRGRVGEIEPYGEGVDMGDALCGQRGERRRVNASREISSDWDVRHELALHRIVEQRRDLLD